MAKNKNNAKQSAKTAVLQKINDFERCNGVYVFLERFLKKFRRYPFERGVIALRRVCECVKPEHGAVWRRVFCGKVEKTFVVGVWVLGCAKEESDFVRRFRERAKSAL